MPDRWPHSGRRGLVGSLIVLDYWCLFHGLEREPKLTLDCLKMLQTSNLLLSVRSKYCFLLNPLDKALGATHLSETSACGMITW